MLAEARLRYLFEFPVHPHKIARREKLQGNLPGFSFFQVGGSALGALGVFGFLGFRGGGYMT